MKLLNGKILSEKLLQELKRKVVGKSLKLNLAIIAVGKNMMSQVFIRQKEKACARIGIGFQLFAFPEDIKVSKLKQEIALVAKDHNFAGIVIQLPLPKHLPSQEILNLVPPEKDIDVLSEANLGKFYTQGLGIAPPAIEGIKRLLQTYRISPRSRNAALIGAGDLVGLPLALWFLKEKATVSVAHSLTKDLGFFTSKADIVVSGVGKPGLIEGSMVKKGVVLLDAGTSLVRGKVTGDVDFESCAKKASFITPVPGGVGPMTVACLLENLVKLNL